MWRNKIAGEPTKAGASRLTTVLFVLALLTLAYGSCMGKRIRPPPLVPPSVTKGYATLVTRVSDGAWVHFSTIAALETFYPARSPAAFLIYAHLVEACDNTPAWLGETECRALTEAAFSPTPESVCPLLPPADQRVTVDFLLEHGFRFTQRGGEAEQICNGRKMREGIEITPVRLARILEKLVSPHKNLLAGHSDDEVVNFLAKHKGFYKSSLCGMEQLEETGTGWFVGWMPCKDPLYSVIVYGAAPRKKAAEIIQIIAP